MSPFDDPIADKGQPPLDKLTPMPAAQLARLRAAHPGLPEGYLDFLAQSALANWAMRRSCSAAG